MNKKIVVLGNALLVIVSAMIIPMIKVDMVVAEEQEIKYVEGFTPVPEDVFDFAAFNILDIKLKANILQKYPLDPWEPESDTIKGIIKMPVFDLEDRICEYLILGYYGKGETPTLEELEQTNNKLWEERLRVLYDENVEVKQNDEIQNDFEELNGKSMKELSDKFVHACMRPYQEFYPGGPVNYGVGALTMLPYFKARLEVFYPGEMIQFHCFRYIDGCPCFEFYVGEKRKIIRPVKASIELKDVYDPDDLSDLPDLYDLTRKSIDSYEENKQAWEKYFNRDMEQIEEYKQMLIDSFGSLYNYDTGEGTANDKLGDLSSVVPDFYDKFKEGGIYLVRQALK